MDRFIFNEHKCVCTIDGDKIVPLMRCNSTEECIDYCNKLNGIKDDKAETENRYDKVGRQNSH